MTNTVPEGRQSGSNREFGGKLRIGIETYGGESYRGTSSNHSVMSDIWFCGGSVMRHVARIVIVVAFICSVGRTGQVGADEIPVISPIPDQSVELGSVWTYDVEATGTPAPLYRLIGDIPNNMTINHNTGVITYKPSHITAAGWRTMTVRATNAAGYDQKSFILTVTLPVHTLELSSTDGGSVTTPGEGSFEYTYNDLVDIEATPDPNCRLIGWTGTSVDHLVCPLCASVQLRVYESGTLVANFEPIKRWCTLGIDSSEGGEVWKPGEGFFTYAQGTIVTLIATEDSGWDFVGWTGMAVYAGKVASPADFYTTVTVDDDYTLTACFAPCGSMTKRILTIHAGTGGDVPYPGMGPHAYYEGTQAGVRAEAYDGYRFSCWTGTAVEAGAVAHPAFANTTVTIDADYTITANFIEAGPPVQHILTISSTSGGSVSSPGEGAFPYDEGTVVPLIAQTDSGYKFSSWTGSAVDADMVANPALAGTQVLVSGDYTLTANFTSASDTKRVLTITSTTGGDVSLPGEGSFICGDGQELTIGAQTDPGYRFSGWTGTAVDAGKVASPTSASTTVTVDLNYSLCANFAAVELAPMFVRVLTPEGGENLAAGNTVSISWQIQGEMDRVNIELSIDGGATWMQLSQQRAADGAWVWEVPSVNSDDCLIRVSSTQDAEIFDTSDSVFRISTPAGRIWYVDAAATGAADGTSWVDAFVYLQDALTQAVAGDSILVAEGLYRPDLGDGIPKGNRTASFQLKDGVAIYGGYPPEGGDRSRRNPAVYRSILSGEIGAPGEATDNSYHVVTASGTGKTSVLDGCTISDGCANGADPCDRGAGLYNSWGGSQIRNCTFLRNTAVGDGGAIYNGGCDVTLVNCIFTANTAGDCGGGLYNEGTGVTLINCTLVANEGLWRGGAVFNSLGTTTAVNSILWGNSRQYGYEHDQWAQADGDPVPALDYCCVQGSTSLSAGEGIFGLDPLFANIAGSDTVVGTLDDDLRLLPDSPCIDAANDAALRLGTTTDAQGKPRVSGVSADLGAYELDVDR